MRSGAISYLSYFMEPFLTHCIVKPFLTHSKVNPFLIHLWNFTCDGEWCLQWVLHTCGFSKRNHSLVCKDRLNNMYLSHSCSRCLTEGTDGLPNTYSHIFRVIGLHSVMFVIQFCISFPHIWKLVRSPAPVVPLTILSVYSSPKNDVPIPPFYFVGRHLLSFYGLFWGYLILLLCF